MDLAKVLKAFLPEVIDKVIGFLTSEDFVTRVKLGKSTRKEQAELVLVLVQGLEAALQALGGRPGEPEAEAEKKPEKKPGKKVGR